MITQTVEVQLQEGVTEVVLRLLPVAAPPLGISKGTLGIDVSRWQGVIDWEKVAAAGVVFAGIRATTGATGKDAQFARNWVEAKRVGIQRMAYHYFINHLEPISQLENFLESLGDDLGELPPVLDIEPRNISPDPNVTIYETINKPHNTELVRRWLIECEYRTQRKLAIYGNAWSLGACTTYPTATTWLNEYHLWLAAHTTRPVPAIPEPWTRYMVWQYTDKGRIDGIDANVDLNRWGE